ncbi:B12-binding domain-containing radical SAM protein [Acutalibacter muris]|uniref:B12-binding domain-containing radical SAM protein n=1 Tax=Acutalibacter muris TaxID=1796620 RepID=UPI001C3EBAB0|nr:radical SAM protein [Acutalibacter muris]
MECDVLIVKPADQKNVYGGLDAFSLTAYEPPLWTALLAGHIRGAGYSVKLLDVEVEKLSAEEAAKRIIELDPRLTVISVSGTNPSASTQNMLALRKIVNKCRELEHTHKYIAAQGIHVSALPERTLAEEKLDFVCCGEGFYTITPLVEAIKRSAVSAEELRNIPGLCFRTQDKPVKTEAAPLYKNLDELPMAAWDLLPMEKYRAHNWHCFGDIDHRQPYGLIWTALGCPFHCHFCCINTMFNSRPGIRFRSPKKVLEEIDYLVNTYGIHNFKIADELFAMKEQRVAEICQGLIERNYHLNIWTYGRVDTVTPAMLEIMKKAGINWIAYGFESGNKTVLEEVSKGYDFNTVDAVVKMTYGAGMHIAANFMFGLPKDNYDSMQQTLQMAFDINAEWANFNSVMAYPGSGLYGDAVKSGSRLPETWQGYSQYAADCLPMDTEYLSAEEVVAFRDYAFKAYFTNPRYLKRMENIFGLETVEVIKEMTSRPLRRNN